MLWSPEQQRALDAVGRWLAAGGEQPFLLAGCAGTGKTTLARHIGDSAGGTVRYCAFTGKAAHVLQRKGCSGAQTIHSLIYLRRDGVDSAVAALEKEISLARDSLDEARVNAPAAVPRLEEEIAQRERDLADVRARLGNDGRKVRFALNPMSEARFAKLLIVDEGSMLDQRMAEDLLSFGVPILVLYDPAQLPPVKGAGYLTRRRPDVFLEEVHRQARESSILRIATAVRHGARLEPGRHGDDLEIIARGALSKDEVFDRVRRADQLLVGTNAMRRANNSSFRRRVGRGDTPYPVSGDKVICLRNDREVGLLNGSLWRVHDAHVHEQERRIAMTISSEDDLELRGIDVLAHTCHFDGTEEKIAWYERTEAQEFTYGYAITVHKSQGSQWDDVVLLDESRVFGADATKWLYTGITRAAKRLTILL